MKLYTIVIGCVLALQSFTAFSAAPEKLNRENNFDRDWRFLKADAPGAENAAFDDSAWRTLDLPHDWSLEDLPQTATNANVGCGPGNPAPTNAPGGGRGRGAR